MLLSVNRLIISLFGICSVYSHAVNSFKIEGLMFDFVPSIIFIGATTNNNSYAEVGVIVAKVAGYKIKGG